MTLDRALAQSPDSISPRVLRALVRLHWPGLVYELAAKIRLNPSSLSSGLSGKVPLKPEVIRRILVALALEEKARYE